MVKDQITKPRVYYPRLLRGLMQKGYIIIWCFTCQTSRLHKPIKVNKNKKKGCGTDFIKKTRYKCNICGAMRDF